MSRWTSTKKKSPKADADILYVIVPRGSSPYVKRGTFSYDGNEWWWCDENGDFSEEGNDPGFSTVTHWMPTPEPPEGL